MHNVYVIKLDDSVANLSKVEKENPNRNPSKPCVYVGMTGRTPEERFSQHKEGYKASRYAKKYGIELMPELYTRFNPMNYEVAVAKEKELARELRKKGYTVLGGH